MLTREPTAAPAALLITMLSCGSLASASFPVARNVTWRSTNFKTLLQWEPKPTPDYTYTVEFSVIGKDRERNPHCIRTAETECDLSSSLKDLKASYVADILSEPPLGVTSDLIEFPHTRSPKFCPYEDTDISRPDFKIEEDKDKGGITLYVSDPLTALFDGSRRLSMRDILTEDLQYKVTYRKARSSGKRVQISKSSVIEMANLDRGHSYCFNVQAYIPSRGPNKQLGELSQTKCSQEDISIFEMYSVGVVVGTIAVILAVLIIIITTTVVCCKRRGRSPEAGKEAVPLRGV